jgi:hypothetical protein
VLNYTYSALVDENVEKSEVENHIQAKVEMQAFINP